MYCYTTTFRLSAHLFRLAMFLSFVFLLPFLPGLALAAVAGPTFIIRNTVADPKCSSVGFGTGSIFLAAGLCRYHINPGNSSALLLWNLKLRGLVNQ